jgi:ATP-dependent RNA helicase DeaD
MTSQAKAKEFAALGLDAQLVTALVALGYEEPTPIQRESIPVLIDGGDLLAQAATGTGKTAAFALPMLHRLMSQAASAPRTTRGLVLVPTRELAMQVSEAIHKYGRSSRLSIVPVYGGASIYQQVRALERGAAIVVATPGRALDLLKRGSLDLSHVEMLVLDEADEMLDMGFAEDLDALLEATPATRQTALFSATMPARILSIGQKHLNKPTRITISIEKTAAGKLPRVRQVAYPVGRAHKAMALQRVLDTENPTSALVFCRTRLEVDTLVERLNAHGYRAEALHGGMQQRQRDAVMGRFRQARVDLLIATDVAARGLDIEQLSHVFNYDLPSAPEAYVHRIGRTGRAGRGGTAITLVEPREHRLLRTIERLTKQTIEVCPLPTVADLRARRLELTRATLRERLEAGDFDDVRGMVQSLAEEFDIFDVAAAAVKLVQAADNPENDDALVDLPEPPLVRDRPKSDRPQFDRSGRERPTRGKAARQDDEPAPGTSTKGHPRRSRGAAETVRLFIGAGRQSGIRPADLVGAITNEAGVASSSVGAIDIRDRFSLVDVPAEEAAHIVKVMRGAALRGQKVPVRVDRDQEPGAGRR